MLSRIKNTPGWLVATLGLLAYLAIAIPLSGYMMQERSFFERGFALLTPLPVLAFAGIWLWHELQMGRHLIPRLETSCAPRTTAQIRTERNTSLALATLVIAMVGIPPLLGLWRGDTLNLMTLAPTATWGWVAYAFGWGRLRMAALMIFRGSVIDLNQEHIRRVALGLVIEARVEHPDQITVGLECPMSEGVPRPVLRARPMGHRSFHNSQVFEFPLSDRDALTLVLTATENGDPYKLVHAQTAMWDIDLLEISAHEKMTFLQDLISARARVDEMMPGLRAA